MWQLDLTEEEFYSVRSEQNLLVDFINFPYRLIELLQKCLMAPMTENGSAGLAPFFAQLTMNPDSTAHLSFIERTSFRQVTQLTLKLKSVESEVLKRKLADLLKSYRDQISSLQSQLSSTTTTNTFVNRTNVNSNFTPPQSTQTHSQSQSQTQTQTHSQFQNQSQIPKTPSHVHTAQSTLVREKDEACAHLNQLYEVTREAKTRLETETADLKSELESLQGQFEESQGEVLKANEIIAKLQEEVRSLKAKMKSSASIADDQMNAAEQLRASNKRLQQEYTEVAEKAHSAKIQAESLERDNKTLKGQIEGLERAIQQRDAIISHHQRQSNVKDLDRAIRSLDLPDISAQPTEGTAEGENDFSFESSTGYVGSRIFDQTF
jgi:spindle assembly abnormal protein 6